MVGFGHLRSSGFKTQLGWHRGSFLNSGLSQDIATVVGGKYSGASVVGLALVLWTWVERAEGSRVLGARVRSTLVVASVIVAAGRGTLVVTGRVLLLVSGASVTCGLVLIMEREVVTLLSGESVT